MTFRTSALAVLVACSGDHYHGIDAPPPDAVADSVAPSSGDPTATAVALTVTQVGVPVANATVYFQRPDSTLVAALVTDARGIAWAELGDDGFVTAMIAPGQTGASLLTFTGTQPGDRLRLDLDPVAPVQPTTFTLKVPLQAGAVGYAIRDACGGEALGLDATGSGDVTVPNCGALTDDFVVRPVDSDGNYLGLLYAPNVALAATTTLPGAYTSLDSTSLGYTDVPATIAYVEAYRAIITPRGRVFDQTVANPPSGGAVAFSIGEPHATGTTALTVTTGMPTDGMMSEQLVYDWTPWGSPYALDVGAQALGDYASQPAIDTATGTIRWTEAAAATHANVARSQLHISRDNIVDSRSWTWRIVAARDSTPALVLPRLPVVDFDYNPQSTDAIAVDELTNALVPGGYPAVRAHGFANWPDLVGSGHMVVETLYAPAL